MNYPILQSLAYLKINSEDDRGKIYLDNFIPFIIESLKEHKEEVINLQLLQDIVKRKFGLTIPQNVIKAILHRSRKLEYVRYNNSNHYKNESKIKEFSFTPLQNKVERIYSSLLAGLIGFANDKYQVSISESEAEALLLSFISYYQIDFYETEKVNQRLIEESTKPDKSKRYIVASFILNAKNQDHQIYEYIDVVVKGFMIAQVLYLPDAHETTKKFTRTKVFLDTSFIIYALGYSGAEFKNSSTELLELLYKNNASLNCFEHTVEEIEGILLACTSKLGSISDGAFGRTLRYFQSIGDTPFDIRLKISHLRRNIQNLNIQIVKPPEYSDERFVPGEPELFDLLKVRMPQGKEEAIRKDVASISAIYRYRKNDTTNFVENSTALFVTTNPTLALASNDYFYKYHDRELAPPCVTDYYLTNILWLKSPHQAPELPMKRVIADAYAAIQPSDAIVERWLAEVSRMRNGEAVTEEDFYFMRSSEEVYIALMEHTLGDARAITSDKAKTIVQSAKDKIRLQVEEKYIPELRDSNKSIMELRKELRKSKVDSDKRRERREDISRDVARISVRILQLLIALILFVAITTTLPDMIFGFDLLTFMGISLPSYVKGIVLLLFAILTVITNYFGVSVIMFLRPVQVWIEKQTLKLLESISEKI